MDVESEVRALFDRYLTTWNGRDFPGVAACFAEPALFVLPHADVPLKDRQSLVAMLETMFAKLEADGFSHTEIGPLSAGLCSEAVAVVDVKDIARLRADGSVMELIDGHYVSRKGAEGWRFTVAIACEAGWQAAR